MKKIIIWGHKLHSHTHSYIHAAFFKTFSFLGYDTYWFDDGDNVDNFIFKDCIFITEGQCDKKIPLDKSNKYILHNCDLVKYKDVPQLLLQVYSNGNENSLGVSGKKVSNYTYYDENTKTLYQPWATDLLPHEIETSFTEAANKTAIWIGTIGSGYHGNINELEFFISGLIKRGYHFTQYNNKSIPFEENKTLIQQNELAPAIVGRWQKINGYIPCRIFKNISYGQLGVTNSKDVFSLLEENVVYNSNEEQLIDDCLSLTFKQKKELFSKANNLIKSHHTYLNRIHTILQYL